METMLLAVFSDSHGDTARMRDVIRRFRPDCVAFLGDGVRDAEAVRAAFPALPFHIVRGNCDGAAPYPDSDVFELDGVRFFAAHGHNHGVNCGMDAFGTSALCSGAAYGLYGHTHRALYQDHGRIPLLNPGSVGDARHPTFALLELTNGDVTCRILDYEEEIQ